MICEFYVPITRELSDAGTHTILGALETLIWWGDIPACLKSFSDILLIRLKRDDREGGAGVEILPNLPLGRFAFDFYEQTMERIQLRREIEDALVKLKRKEESLSWTERNGTKYSSNQILQATIQYVESREGTKMFPEELEDDEADEENSSRMDIDSDKNLPAITEQLKTALETLNQRILGLNPLFSVY